jgi:hypothetical protein
MPLGGPAQYLAKYNSYILPGYVQEESFDSSMNIAAHQAPYVDGSLSEYVGLQNKVLALKLKVWEQDYQTCKDQVELGATYLRSKKAGFADLYVQYSDRHYEALTESIRVEKTAGQSSPRTLEYDVQFSCRPWLIEDAIKIITGTGTINTDQVSRTINDGGWTPTVITVTGTDVTISGYTDTIPFTGYINITGAVTGMIIDAENMTAEISGVNRNDLMINQVDYSMFVGPDKTYFNITGASSCSISYHNRWYI